MTSRLVLGTVQFGLDYGIANQAGQVSQPAVDALLNRAREGGLDMLDTAIAYGDSETRLGAAGIDDFRVITKLPSLPPDCADVAAWVRRQLDESLARLGVDTVYGLLLHDAKQLTGPLGKALLGALSEAKQAGRIAKLGVSIYAPDELAAISQCLRMEIVQAPLNLLDHRLVDSGWMQRLHDTGVEIHVRSSFLQGLLLMPEAEVPVKFSPWRPLWSRWHAWLADHPGQAVAACLAYPMSFPQVDRVVVGVDSLTQFEELLAAEKLAFTMKDLPDLHTEEERLINPSLWGAL